MTLTAPRALGCEAGQSPELLVAEQDAASSRQWAPTSSPSLYRAEPLLPFPTSIKLCRWAGVTDLRAQMPSRLGPGFHSFQQEGRTEAQQVPAELNPADIIEQHVFFYKFYFLHFPNRSKKQTNQPNQRCPLFRPSSNSPKPPPVTRSVMVGVLTPPLILVPWEGGLHPLGSLLIWTEGITAPPRLGSCREERPSFSQQRQRPCVLEKESCPGKQKNSKTPAALQSRPAQSLPLLTPLPAATATAVSSSRPFVNPDFISGSVFSFELSSGPAYIPLL